MFRSCLVEDRAPEALERNRMQTPAKKDLFKQFLRLHGIEGAVTHSRAAEESVTTPLAKSRSP